MLVSFHSPFCSLKYHLTTRSEEPPYPEWAQFVGALIVLLSVTMIPLLLIVRLIGYQHARDEAKEFIILQIQSAKDLVTKCKAYIKRRYDHQPFPYATICLS